MSFGDKRREQAVAFFGGNRPHGSLAPPRVALDLESESRRRTTRHVGCILYYFDRRPWSRVTGLRWHGLKSFCHGSQQLDGLVTGLSIYSIFRPFFSSKKIMKLLKTVYKA